MTSKVLDYFRSRSKTNPHFPSSSRPLNKMASSSPKRGVSETPFTHRKSIRLMARELEKQQVAPVSLPELPVSEPVSESFGCACVSLRDELVSVTASKDQEIAFLRNSFEYQLSALQETKTSVDQELSALQEAKISVDQELSALKEAKQANEWEASTIAASLDLHRQELSALQEAKISADKELAALQKAKTSVDQELSALQEAKTSELSALQETKTSVDQELSALQKAKTSVDQELSALQEAKTSVDRELSALRKAKSAVDQELSALKETKTSELSALQKAKTSVDQELSTLQEAKTSVDRELSSLRERLSSTLKKIASVNDERDLYATKNLELEESLAEAERVKASLTRRFDEDRVKLQDRENRMRDAYETRLKDFARALEDSRSSVNQRLESELDSLRKDRESLLAAVESLKTKLDASIPPRPPVAAARDLTLRIPTGPRTPAAAAARAALELTEPQKLALFNLLSACMVCFTCSRSDVYQGFLQHVQQVLRAYPQVRSMFDAAAMETIYDKVVDFYARGDGLVPVSYIKESLDRCFRDL